MPPKSSAVPSGPKDHPNKELIKSSTQAQFQRFFVCFLRKGTLTLINIVKCEAGYTFSVPFTPSQPAHSAGG